MSSVKIRQLKRSDRKFLTSMFERLATKIGSNGLLNLFTADVKETVKEMADEKVPINPKMVAIIISTMKLLIEHFEVEMDTWFSDLLECKAEDLDKMSFGVDLEIIVQLVESKEAEDFFSNALRLRNWTIALAKLFNPKKTG